MKESLLLTLFSTFFKIGLFTFGGGYAMIPIMQREVIRVHQWMDETQFLDIVGVSEMTPGVIAVNMGTFLGFTVSGGPLGGIVATLGVILPSSLIVYLVTRFFFEFKDNAYVKNALRWIRPVVLGLIASAGFTLMNEAIRDGVSVLIGVAVFYLSAVKKVNPIFILLGVGVFGLIYY
ncbi:MAG TPA: chromate transporter [Eubacteriaceae bacterium]|nr:chromate transporter [Eubacteriaceae bacterium]